MAGWLNQSLASREAGVCDHETSPMKEKAHPISRSVSLALVHNTQSYNNIMFLIRVYPRYE